MFCVSRKGSGYAVNGKDVWMRGLSPFLRDIDFIALILLGQTTINWYDCQAESMEVRGAVV